MTLERGEEYLVLDDGGDWWKAKNKCGQIGLIPSNYVLEKSRYILSKFDWFLPDLDRDQAEAILKTDNRDGSFLVRLSTTEENCFTISLLIKSYVNHLIL